MKCEPHNLSIEKMMKHIFCMNREWFNSSFLDKLKNMRIIQTVFDEMSYELVKTNYLDQIFNAILIDYWAFISIHHLKDIPNGFLWNIELYKGFI